MVPPSDLPAPFRPLLLGALGLMALSTAGSAQVSSITSERPTLVGTLTRTDLQRPPFAAWFDRQYSQYQPDSEMVDRLRAPLASVSIEVYFGTWCFDSRRQVPRLLRLLDALDFDDQRLLLVGLSDRPMEFKKAPGNPEVKRLVHRTPTIIVLREGTEVGRIVETPATSLEADLLAIVEGHGPRPKYPAEALVHRLFTTMTAEAAGAALQAAEEDISKSADAGSLWHYAEHDLLKNGRAREARAVLDLHLKIEPRSVIGHVLMSDALAALGRRTEALEAAQRALAIEPGNDRAQRAAEALRPD